MYTKEELIEQLTHMPMDPKGTIIVHSSMKAIGDVEGGANTVLDAFSQYMKEGLLIFPTHTWGTIGEEQPVFDAKETPSHIGILTELFWKRPHVYRSLHPTHSVAALGADAEAFTAGQEAFDTPTARESSWGKLLDRQAKILLVGVDLRRCTFIHGIEEWLDIPGRFKDGAQQLYTVLPNGTKHAVPSRRHVPGISEHYWKVEEVLAEKGAITYATFGDAKTLICDTEKITDYLTKMLEIDPALFSDNKPLTAELAKQFRAL